MAILYWFENKIAGILSGRPQAEEAHVHEHLWQAWEYISPYTCEQRRSCGRCHSRKSRIFHQWDAWEADRRAPGYSMIRCSRCDSAICPELVHHLLGPFLFP